jgi:hypothetical protein
VISGSLSKPPLSATQPPHRKRYVYVKSALAGSNFFFRTYNGFSNRRLRQLQLENRLILHSQAHESGHTREEASIIRGPADGARRASLQFRRMSQHCRTSAGRGDPFTRRGVHGSLGDEPRHDEPLRRNLPIRVAPVSNPRVESKEMKGVHWTQDGLLWSRASERFHSKAANHSSESRVFAQADERGAHLQQV